MGHYTQGVWNGCRLQDNRWRYFTACAGAHQPDARYAALPSLARQACSIRCGQDWLENSCAVREGHRETCGYKPHTSNMQMQGLSITKYTYTASLRSRPQQ